MSSILIVGAGFLQSFVIQKAKDMGYHTIAIDKNPNAIGFMHAHENAVIDIIDQEACFRFAKEKNVNGVITAATDYGVLSASYIAQRMNLPGLKYEIAQVVKNKYMIRRVLIDKGVDDFKQYFKISTTKDLDEISKIIQFPVMVKPCDGSGSKSVSRVDSISDLRYACEKALEASYSKCVLIEDFVEGNEYGVESFVYNGHIHVLGVMKKYMTNPPYYAELGHSMPSCLNIEEKVKEVARKAIEAIGIDFGAVNMDVLVTDKYRICIVDIGARMGGNLIGSHIIPLGTGIDYMENLIRATAGESVTVKPSKPKTKVATRLLALTPGKVKKLPNFNEISEKYNVLIYHSLEEGNIIREYKNNLDGCGYIVATSDDLSIAENRAEEVKKIIDISIERE